MNVLAFAWAKDAIGADQIQLELPEGSTVEGLMRRLAESHPKLAERAEALTIAVNEEFVGPDHSVHAGDEIALIPPISGGRLVSDL